MRERKNCVCVREGVMLVTSRVLMPFDLNQDQASINPDYPEWKTHESF